MTHVPSSQFVPPSAYVTYVQFIFEDVGGVASERTDARLLVYFEL